MVAIAAMGCHGCQVNVRGYKYRYFTFIIMNFLEGDTLIIRVQKKHKCTICDFRTHKKYNLNVHLRNIHGISYIKEQPTQIQSGSDSVVNSTTHIPIEKYKEVVDETHKWKFENEKLQEERKLLQEYRREDGEYFMQHITNLENLLDLHNINYTKYSM